MQSPDSLNYCVVRIQTMFNDIELSKATGFFYRGIAYGKPNMWLITNWHVLSGRNAENPNKILHTQCALPNRLRIQLPSSKDGEGREVQNKLFLHEKFLDIYDNNGHALWYQHQEKNLVDIAVINFGSDLKETLVQGINELATQFDMAVEIGNDIFILGYPLGFTHFFNTPIWKRGSIASEPHAETSESKGKIMIDATTRTGMSGSPVIMRYKTHYLSETGKIISHPNATRFIGVYSSRPAPANEIKDCEDKRQELGYVFKSGFIPEIIEHGIRGPSFGEKP